MPEDRKTGSDRHHTVDKILHWESSAQSVYTQTLAVKHITKSYAHI